MKIIVRLVLLTILMPTLAYAVGNHQHDGNKNSTGVEALSPDLRALLTEEMRALQIGMMSIVPAYVSGDWGKIETIAGKMKNSYILKKKLTKPQAKELHSVLPHAFIEKDQRFHYLAGMLEHAAKNKKPELINFYFSEMNKSCVECHTVYAAHRFPALSAKAGQSKHSH